MSYPTYDLTLNQYQERARETADYPLLGTNLLYPSLKLNGEAGEVAEKVGKLWRNKGVIDPKELTPEERDGLILEVSDVLWYCAALASELGINLGEVAERNLAKLADRKQRGTIKGEGDYR